ncbi:hypothetical protein TNCV_3212861 [Trichonephila clavipes]|nr:hypothetical protein TNCV_3212861 [Trichonephila clavipes]
MSKRSSSRDVGTSSYRYHIARYSPASVSVNRRTNDTIFVASIRLSEITAYLRQCLTVWLLLRWIDGAVHITSESPMKEGRSVLGTFRCERMQVLNRSRQNDRLHVMLVLVHTDITPPQSKQSLS